jgi:hypothetical protein
MKTLGKVLLALIVLELSLGGGGRWMDGDGLPRIILFCFGMGYSIVAVLIWPSNGLRKYSEAIPPEFLFLVALFLVLSLFSMSVAMLNDQSMWETAKGLRPQSYFLLLPFFALAIRSSEDVIRVSGILKLSAVALSVFFLATMTIWKSGLVTAAQIVGWLNPSGDPTLEFYFRGDTTFFFKAILYVGVGVFFFAVEEKWFVKCTLLLLMLAIALTMTRGVWLSVFVVLAAWAFFYTSDRLKGAAIAVTFLLIGAIGVVLINETLPSVAVSNAIRMNDMRALPTIWDWQTVFFGKGFRGPIFGRDAVEATYVNVLYRQGLPWLIFWLLPMAYLTWQIGAIKASNRRLALPYFMAAAFTYLVSLTNPFLSSALGISVVMIAMVAVRVIARSGSAELSQSNSRLTDLGGTKVMLGSAQARFNQASVLRGWRRLRR